MARSDFFEEDPIMAEADAPGTLDAIYHRRAIRDYTPKLVDKETINALLDAAVQAPTAMHEEPWSFIVIQDRQLLDRLSESAKERLRNGGKVGDLPPSERKLSFINASGYHVFYNAGTLIVICCKEQATHGMADGWLAAQNLMLAAYAKGLGTCPIGLSVETVNAPEWKKELNIPNGINAVAAIIVGTPAGETSPTSDRKAPVILNWV